MKIRSYNKNDLNDIHKLFYSTVHFINCRDYSKDQLNVWAKDNIDLDSWGERYLNTYSIVVELNDNIVGFSNIEKDGTIDMFFVHKDYQSIGIASLMLDHLVKYAKANNIETLMSHVSITAKNFFKKQGFKIQSEDQVKIDNISFTNYTMTKAIKTIKSNKNPEN